jgi:hypothetical protein
MRFFFINIVKKGHMLLPTFDPTQKIKKRKKKKNPKYKRIYIKKA